MGELSPIDRATLPAWPRLLSEPMAARYLSISVNNLREHGPDPKRHGRRVLYDIRDLDRWADRLGDMPLDERAEQAEAEAVERRFLEGRKRG